MLNPFQSIEVRLCCPCPHRAAILQKGPHICIIRGNKSRFIVVTPHSLDTSNQKVKSSVPALDCRVYVVRKRQLGVQDYPQIANLTYKI